MYIELCKTGQQPKIITMDVDMPIMNGKEAAMKIREFEISHGFRPARMIFISGNCIESEISQCMDPIGKIRAYGFYKKPMKPNVFREIFRL
jgi:CheY-like chemotaxis protein